MEVTIKASDFNKQIKKSVDDLIKEATIKIFNLSQENLVKRGKVDTGELLRSGKFELGKEGKVIYDAPHAEFVEFGTRPHHVPIEPLKRWVRRRLRIANDEEAMNIAFAISNKIARYGLPPSRFLRDAIEEIKERDF